MVLFESDLDELRSLLGGGEGRPAVLHRLPTSAEMKRMSACESLFISCDRLAPSQGHLKAKRMSKDGARFVFRKIDETHAVMIRLE